MRLASAKLLIIVFEVFLLLVVLSVLVFEEIFSSVKYAPIVHLKSGKVRGIVQDVDPGLKVYFYQGIRYGRAERFRKPFPAESWTGIYQATTPRAACPFNGIEIKAKRYLTTTISEDCLFLNVWRPITDKPKRAVMFYVHGGSFHTGTIFKFTHDGRYISARGDVIVVSINYRLGPFGFLYGGTEDAPGNMGLLDMIEGLRWVQENIAHFGGDPQKVTIFGNSAGSAAVGSMVLSPLTQNLFRRAILQSGSPTMNANSNASLEATRALAKAANCPIEPMKSTLRCLKMKSVEDLLNATKKAGDPCTIMFGDAEHVMPLSAVEALNSGQFYSGIDLMFGGVKDEGPSFLAGDLLKLGLDNVTFSVEFARQSIAKIMIAKGIEYGEEVAQWYTANLTDHSQVDLRNLIGTAYGDYFMTCPIILFGEQFARIAPQNRYYAWRLMKRAGVHVMGMCQEEWMGVCHADELFYLFSIPDQKTPEEIQLSHDMIKAWANFADGQLSKIGTVQWMEAFDRTRNDTITRHMDLDPLNYTMVDGFYKRTCDDFWRERIFV